jgi:carboxymethylenebutenolidase
MRMRSEWVEFDTPSGLIPAYLAYGLEAPGPLPGILVMHEIWGVNEHILDVTERFARAGYGALAPDLYSPGGSRPAVLARDRVELAKHFFDSVPPEQWTTVLNDEARRAEALAGIYQSAEDQDRAAETLLQLFAGVRSDITPFVRIHAAAAGYLRGQEICSGTLGSVGWCLGGRLSARLACDDAHPQAAVIFYGSAPSGEGLASLRCPVRGFYGQDDPPVVAGLASFEAELQALGADHELRVYPDTPHAFFNDTRPSYRVGPARDAWARTLAFFAQTLEPAPLVDVADAAAAA